MVNRTIWKSLSRLLVVDTCFGFFLPALQKNPLSGFGESLLHDSWWEVGSLLYYRIYPISPHPMEARWKEGQLTSLSQSDPLTQNSECQVGDLASR